MEKKGLIEQREDLKIKMQEIIEQSKKEERTLNEEEVKKFDDLERTINDINSTIERIEKTEKMEVKREVKNEEKTLEEREVKEFADFIRNRETNLTKGDNGAIIPKTIVNKIIDKVVELSPIYNQVTKYNAKGTLVIPKVDEGTDAITVGFADEFTELEGHANKFATIELTGYLYGALTKVSKSLINNTDIDLTNWVVNRLAQGAAKFIENTILNGALNKVAGIAGTVDANNKKTLASKTAITADELIDLQDLIPDAYQANAIWVMNKATRTALRKLKLNNGEYVLNKDLSSAFGYTLLGKDVYVSDNVEKLGQATKNVIFYGDFSGVAVKETEQAQVQVLYEKYATQHAIGVQLWGEIDAKIEDAQKIAVAVTGA